MTPEEYAAKREARYNRLIAAAEKAEKESTAAWNQARSMAEVIPFGQPILVGHHSERRDRNYRARIESKHRKGYELHQRAEELKSRAEAMQNNNAIYTDNPQAVDLLSDKVKILEAEQAEMKRINAALRKGADFETLEMSERHRADLLTIARVQAYYQPLTKGFPPYALSNLSAQIRTAKKRAEQVEKQQTTERTEKTINGVQIVHNPEDNRVQMFFKGKPAEEIRALLKSHGFRWTPSQGCWQAYYNNPAKWNADEIAEKVTQ